MTMLALAALLVAAVPTASLAQSDECAEARCAVQSQINAECSCDEASNHGRYVSCVAQVVNRLSKNGTIPTNCRGRVKRCAARSTCGKPGFVTCTIPISTCVIDPTTQAGTCANDPSVACAQDLDCGSRCSTKRTAELCEEKGGTVGAGSCCAACVTTP